MGDVWQEVFCRQMCQVKPEDAWSLQSEEHLEMCNLGSGWKKAVQDHAYASFVCSQCYRRWSSHQVVILFHMCWERSLRQGQVRMRLFRQQCHCCSSDQREEPQFTREQMESVIQCLILDIREECYGEHVQRSELLEVVCEGRGPHKREFCEACQMGLHKGRRGKRDGAPHHGRSDSELHDGKPGRPLYCERSESPTHSRPTNFPSYEDLSIHTSWWRSLIQPPQPAAASVTSRPCRIFCICCVLIAVVCAILLLVAYWDGWFKG